MKGKLFGLEMHLKKKYLHRSKYFLGVFAKKVLIEGVSKKKKKNGINIKIDIGQRTI